MHADRSTHNYSSSGSILYLFTWLAKDQRINIMQNDGQIVDKNR